MSFIEVESVYKNYGKTPVLRGINWKVEKASQVCIQGASGSGKSTLLYLLAGLDRSDKGNINVEGRSLNQLSADELSLYRNHHVGLVFQFHYLLPTLTAKENILLPARIGSHDIKKVEKFALGMPTEQL